MIPWPEEAPVEAIRILNETMLRAGTDDPVEVVRSVNQRLNHAIERWADGGSASDVNAAFIAWSMLRFHLLVSHARAIISLDNLEQREALEGAIVRIREKARRHQDWGIAVQQLAAELDELAPGH